MLHLKQISIKLGKFELKNISFDVARGDYFVILGESGIGKSVLLEIIAGLLIQDSGFISLNDTDISSYSIQNRDIGLVYQNQALFPHLNVAQNVGYALQCKKESRTLSNEKIVKMSKKVGVEHLLGRHTNTLSLGEAQRVALARTLISNPSVLLLDEPLSSLDIKAKSQMRSLLRKINQAGQTIIHITHDYEEAIALASKIAILEQHSITQIGTPDAIFTHPKSEFIAHFTGVRNYYRGSLTMQSESLGLFKTSDLSFYVATNASKGMGNLILKKEDITLSKSLPESSARNHFQGEIVDIESVRLGMEVTVDIGVLLTALITKESFERMNLKLGHNIWTHFKATAAKYIEVR